MEQAQGPESGCKCSIGSNTYFFLCSTQESGQEKRAGDGQKRSGVVNAGWSMR
jgi:hypothetical protein